MTNEILTRAAEVLERSVTLENQTLAAELRRFDTTQAQLAEADALLTKVMHCTNFREIGEVEMAIAGYFARHAQAEQQEAQGAQAGDERAAFEEWISAESNSARREIEYRNDLISTEDPGFYAYRSSELQLTWKGWKARAALATQPAAGEALVFANELISGALEGGDFSGADIQELAVKHGLLREERREESCREEGCACAEYGFPTECYRKTAALAHPAAAPVAAGEPMYQWSDDDNQLEDEELWQDCDREGLRLAQAQGFKTRTLWAAAYGDEAVLERLRDLYESGYGAGQNNPNGYSNLHDREWEVQDAFRAMRA